MHNPIKKFIITTIGLLAFLSPFSFVAAQAVTQSIDLSINTVPADPRPKEIVTLTAESFSLDLASTFLTWTYGGKTIGSGLGKTSISVIAPDAGAVGTVTVTAATGGAPVSASSTLRPGSVDLLFEGIQASVPPFYKGLPLVAPTGTYRVVAIPSANAPKVTDYQWSRNGSALGQLSGISKSSLLLQNTVLSRSDSIAVTVSGGVFEGEGSITVPTQTPDVIAYQKREGFVDYTRGFRSTMPIVGSGAIIRFEPFFFSTPSDVEHDLVFEIKAGEETFSPTPENELRLARPEGGGDSRIQLGITTATYSLQNISRAFTFSFQ